MKKKKEELLKQNKRRRSKVRKVRRSKLDLKSYLINIRMPYFTQETN